MTGDVIQQWRHMHRLRNGAAVAAFAFLGCGSNGAVPSEAGAGAADASPDAACVTASLTFQLDVSGASPTTYCDQAPGACGESWLNILSEDGGSTFSLVQGCVPECAAGCQAASCLNVCLIPKVIDDGGLQMSWDGSYFEHDVCGASSTRCSRTLCAPSGRYVAQMCGYAAVDAGSPAGYCSPSAAPTCTNVPFDWPPSAGTTAVAGQIGGDLADASGPD
jgi:hypothetical protein